MSGNCELGRGLLRREKNATEGGAGRFEKPAPDARAAPPEAHESLIGRKTVEEVPLTGLSLLGVPYSDPIADGPVIQASYTRALAAGFTLEKFFEMVRKATGRVKMPILAMVSYSIIYRRGIDRFVDDAAAAGLAGLVVPDLPLEESDVLDATCKGANLALVRLVTPTTPPERAAEIAKRSTGFLYCVSVAGVTGARTDLPEGLVERVKWLQTKTDVPVLVGFGVSTPEQVKLLSSVADGAIVGSALVRRVGELAAEGPEGVAKGVESYIADLVNAAR